MSDVPCGCVRNCNAVTKTNVNMFSCSKSNYRQFLNEINGNIKCERLEYVVFFFLVIGQRWQKLSECSQKPPQQMMLKEMNKKYCL